MRIYKGSEITLKLYTRINCQSIEADKMRVVLFTTNPNNSYMVNNVVVSGDTLLVTVGRNDLNAMEDGVINYIILGYDDNEEIYNSTRQSNYYLKTPDGYVAKSVQTSKDVYIVDNGEYKILPDEDYSSIEEVNVHVEFDTEPYIQRGFELGEENQKSKLESVSITENGTYSREDGYNEVVVDVPDLNGDYQTGYDEGYEAGIDYASENAGDVAAQTARVLNITENGTYTSEYSQWDDYPKPELVTGVFEDGKEFFDYVNLKDNIFFIEKYVTNNSILEFWFKPLSIHNSYHGYILGNGADDNSKFGLYLEYLRWNLYFGGNIVNITLEKDKWYHILLSQEGAFVNNEKIGEYNITEFLSNLNIKIGFFNNFNHFFGMIKLDGDVYIPTENGFINYATGSLLQTYDSLISTNYIYTNNFTEPIAEGNLIRTVNVNVPPKINVAETGLKFQSSTFTEVPSWADFEGITDALNLFCDCAKLKTIFLFDTSKVTSMVGMFGRCASLIAIPKFDTSNVTDMSEMLTDCTSLTTIPQLDTSNVTSLRSIFNKCTSLTTVPPLNAGKLNMGKYYGLFGYYEVPKLTDFGGLIGLKYSLNNDNTFVKCPNLTYQSCINILNGLYDFVGNGETPTSSQGQLKVHSNFLTTVGDEISIGTNKGWTITA